jgi:hypothetical protein
VVIAACGEAYAADAWRAFTNCHALRFTGGDPECSPPARREWLDLARAAITHFRPDRIVIDASDALYAECVASISIRRSERQMSPSTTTYGTAAPIRARSLASTAS